MKKTILAMTMMLASTAAFANDGGIAAIKVDKIRMRETAIVKGEEKIVKKITNPSFKIIIEGGEAAKLQKILPSEASVFTGMYPDQAESYKESFKALGIYSNKSDEATSKVLTISCSDAKLNESYDKVVKTGKSVCTITINGVAKDDDAQNSFGDAQVFEPKTCK